MPNGPRENQFLQMSQVKIGIKTPVSLIVNKIESLTIHFAMYCDKFAETIKSQPETPVIEIIKNSINYNEAIEQIFLSWKTIAAGTQLADFKTLISFLPKSKDQNLENSWTYINRLSKVDFNDKRQQYGIYFLINHLLARVAEKSTSLLDSNSDEDELKEYLETLVNEATYNCTDIEYLPLLFINAPLWNKAICEVSKYIGDSVQTIFDFLADETSPSFTLFIYLFSNSTFKFETMNDAIDFLSRFTEKLKTKLNSNEQTEYLSNFLYNLAGFTFSSFADLRKSEEIFDLYEIAYRQATAINKDLNSYKLMTLCVSYSRNSRIRSDIVDFAKNVLFKFGRPIDVLTSLTILFRGDHYLPEPILERTYDQLTWTIKSERYQNIDVYIDWILSQISKFNDIETQIALSDFIFQVASCDFKVFYETFFPVLIKKENQIKIKLALYRSLLLIFSPHTTFQSKASSCGTTKFKQFKQDVINLISNEFQFMEKNVLSASVVIPRSFAMDLSYASTYEKKTQIKISRILSDFSKPTSAQQDQAKYLTLLNHWKKDLDNPSNWPFTAARAQEFPKPNWIFIDSKYYVNYLITIIPFLKEKEGDLVKIVCSQVLNEKHGVCQQACRVLQATIHFNKNSVDLILESIFTEFINKSLNFESLACLIAVIHNILDTIDFESIKISQVSHEIISKILVTGICSPFAQIRIAAMKAFDLVPNGLTRFIRENEQILMYEAKESAFLGFNPVTAVNGIGSSEDAPFIDIASSNANLVYNFYLSELGSLLRAKKFAIYLEEFLQEMLLNFEIAKKNSVFSNNVTALYLSLVQQENKSFNSIAENVFKDEKIDTLVKIALVSSIHYELSDQIFKCFRKQHRLFAYYFRTLTKYEKFLEKQADCLTKYFDRCYKAFIAYFFKNNIISKAPKFQVQMDNFSDEMKLSVHDFAIASRALHQHIYQSMRKPCTGPFPRVSSATPDPLHKLYQERLFVFWFNLSSFSKKEVCYRDIQLAFASWCQFAPIPDHYFKILQKKFEIIASTTPEITSAIFSYYCNSLMPFYIEKSIKNIGFFTGIADQFVSADKYEQAFLKSVSNPLEENDKSFAQNIIQYYGQLAALSLRYLICDSKRKRLKAFDMLFNITAGVLLVRNQTKEAINIMKSMISHRQNFMGNFSQCIIEDIMEITSLIATYCEFAAEQIISTLFDLEKHFDSPNGSLESTKKKFVKPKKVRLISTPEVIKRPSSTYRMMKFTEPLLTIQIATSSEMRDLMIKLIIPFLNNMCLDPCKPIIPACLEHYRCFTPYSFIQQLVALQSDLSQPVRDIILMLSNSNLNFLLTILTNIFFTCPKLEGELKLFFLFLYSHFAQPVLNFLLTYIELPSWLYFDVQLNKVDQLFDISAFFSISSIDSDQGDDIDYKTVIKLVQTMLKEFAKEDNQPLVPYSSFIHSFLDIMSHNYKSDELKKLIPETNLQYNKNQYIAFLVKWALCCGDLQAACRAVDILLDMNYKIDEDTLKVAVRSLHIVTLACYQKHNMKKKRNVIDIIDSRRPIEPYWDVTYKYIAHITKLIANAEKIDSSLFWTYVSLLNCKNQKQDEIVEVALNNILVFFENPSLLKKQKPSKDFVGLFPLIASAIHNSRSILITDKILRASIKNNLTKFIWPNQKVAVPFIIYAISPFLLENPADSDKISDSLKDKRLKNVLKELINKKRLKKFHEIYVLEFEHTDCPYIVEYFAKMSQTVSESQLQVVLYLSSYLVDDRMVETTNPSLLTILDKAKFTRIGELQQAVHKLLKSVMASTDDETSLLKKQPISRKTFPKIEDKYEFNFGKWELEDQNLLFTSPKYFPPLYMNDLGFYGVEIQTEIKKLIEPLNVKPFSERADLLYHAQTQKTDHSQHATNSQDALNIIKSDHELLDNWNKSQNAFNTSRESIKRRKSIKVEKDNSIPELSIINNKEFCPPASLIDEIGQNLIVDFTVPTVFP